MAWKMRRPCRLAAVTRHTVGEDHNGAKSSSTFVRPSRSEREASLSTEGGTIAFYSGKDVI